MYTEVLSRSVARKRGERNDQWQPYGRSLNAQCLRQTVVMVSYTATCSEAAGMNKKGIQWTILFVPTISTPFSPFGCAVERSTFSIWRKEMTVSLISNRFFEFLDFFLARKAKWFQDT